METKNRRIELMDLSDPKQAEIAIKIVGISLKQAGPKQPLRRAVVNDDTPEGKKALQYYLNRGFRIESIK